MAYTTINKPTDYFNTVLYAGDNATSNAITGVGFKPDWLWIRNRTATADFQLSDIVRGKSGSLYYQIRTNADGEQVVQPDNDGVSSLDSDGFTVGYTNSAAWNNSGNNYVSFSWLAGGSTSSNSDGSITSTVSVNTTAGFSIVKWTGDGNTTTVGHGLGVTPKLYMTKDITNGSTNFHYHTTQIDGGMDYAFLNSTNAFSSSSLSAPDSTEMTVGGTINTSSADFISYVFADKQGYSKFGSYKGNGNADGPFIYTGFKPAWVLQKNAGATQGWQLQDNKRDGRNGANKLLQPHTSQAESDVNRIDILSNGFKVITTDAGQNSSGVSYIYMAFAENPFVSSTGVPCNAR
jgi:hypothetical protein|tara:strand:+ start:2922 stop:3965 length:1044 start_codon:yes stop_codon:yes gene_type:complete